jgi:hypothetical protein
MSGISGNSYSGRSRHAQPQPQTIGNPYDLMPYFGSRPQNEQMNMPQFGSRSAQSTSWRDPLRGLLSSIQQPQMGSQWGLYSGFVPTIDRMAGEREEAARAEREARNAEEEFDINYNA